MTLRHGYVWRAVGAAWRALDPRRPTDPRERLRWMSARATHIRSAEGYDSRIGLTNDRPHGQGES